MRIPSVTVTNNEQGLELVKFVSYHLALATDVTQKERKEQRLAYDFLQHIAVYLLFNRCAKKRVLSASGAGITHAKRVWNAEIKRINDRKIQKQKKNRMGRKMAKVAKKAQDIFLRMYQHDKYILR